jgi:ASC-1-like (ASCH) protein
MAAAAAAPPVPRAEVRIRDPWLGAIARGVKTWEGRLAGGRWAKLRPGDEVVASSETLPRVVLRVRAQREFPDFAAAYRALGAALVPDAILFARFPAARGGTPAQRGERVAEIYADFWPADKVAARGVVAVNVEVVQSSHAKMAPADRPRPATGERLSRNSTSFAYQLKRRLERVTAQDYRGLRPHQARVVRYATDPAMRSGHAAVDGRGAVVTHQMGTGKGILMAAIADRKRVPTVLLATRALLENFRGPRGSVAVYERNSGRRFDWSRVRTATLGAGNMAAQLARAVAEAADPELSAAVGIPRARRSRANPAAKRATREERAAHVAASAGGVSLNGVLLLVDEAHLLARAVANGSENALAVYRAIERSPHAQIYLFTGTPGIDDPFELALLYNMVGPAAHPVFPKSWAEFSRRFVDREAMAPRNEEKWMNRISGLQSHHAGDAGALPRMLPLRMHFVEMHPVQAHEYLEARQSELEEEQKRDAARGPRDRGKAAPLLQRPREEGASTYRVASRQLGNSFAGADGSPSASAAKGKPSAKEPPAATKKGAKAAGGPLDAAKATDPAFAEPEIGARGGGPFIPDSALRSPKAERVLEIAEKAERLVLVYTQFIARGERAIVAAAERAGWTRFDPARPAKTGRVFASITGQVAAEDQTAIVAAANTKDNATGLRVKLVIVSVVATVGLSFIWGSDVVIFEPYWNAALHAQIYARIRRVTSLRGVPPEKRAVQPHILFAVLPKGMRRPARAAADVRGLRSRGAAVAEIAAPFLPFAEPLGLPTDAALYVSGAHRHRLLLRYRFLGERAAIEAAIDGTPGARVCRPTGKPLFISDISADLASPDPCQPFERTTAEVRPIDIDGERFFYAESAGSPFGVVLYEEDKSMAAAKTGPAGPAGKPASSKPVYTSVPKGSAVFHQFLARLEALQAKRDKK